MAIKHFIFSVFLLLYASAFAQDAKLTASVNKTTVGTGEVFEVSYSINGNAEKFSQPDFSGFQVVGGPNQSQSWSNVNGAVSASISVSFDLVATKEGTYTIGPATAVVSGKQLTSNSIKITVVKGRPAQRNNQMQQQAEPDGDVQAPPPADIAKNVFIKASVDKSRVYQGQQLTITYKLYTRMQLLGSQVDQVPDFNNFWNQDVIDLNKNQPVQWHSEILNGVRFNVADIKQTILFPEHSGDLKIDPFIMTLAVNVPVQSRDPFDQFFGASKNVNFKAKSSAIVIHVQPLPAGKPDGFSGGVGKFNLEASLDKKEIRANEAINYQLKITGSGNIKLVDAPAIAFPPDFEKYDPKVTDTVNAKPGGVSGSRMFNYLLIPRHEGNFTIDPVKFSYFDPSSNRYVTLTAKPFQVKVDKGVGGANVTTYSDAGQQDIKVLNKDIRFIKTGNPDLYKQGDQLFGSGLYTSLMVLGPLLFFGAFGYRNWDQRNNSDMVKVRSRKAGKLAAKHLASAALQLQARDTKGFYEDLSKGLYGYISNKFNIPIANLDKETIAAGLMKRSSDEGLTKRMVDTLDLCELARFAPVSGISEQEVFDKAKGLINDIENKI